MRHRNLNESIIQCARNSNYIIIVLALTLGILNLGCGLNNKKMEKDDLVKKIHVLTPWTKKGVFLKKDWQNYIKLAKIIQTTDLEIIERTFRRFNVESSKEKFNGIYESESKIFILIRIIFELPEMVPEKEQMSFKGWVNWPEPDKNGNVNLSWPISWNKGHPVIIAEYRGSNGNSYDAWSEFQYFKNKYNFRDLD